MVDYSASNINYDANGNILTMKQRGLGLSSSATIDSLTYQYFASSNTLQKVIDAMPAIAGNRVDFQDTSLTTDDYVYDANGNIVKDNNRHLHTSANGNGAVFNVLDKPDSMSINGRSGTYYYYDAGGSLLRKQVNKYGAGGSTKNYLYMGGFVYMNDTLQYVLHSEGSVRYARKINSANGVAYYAYEYDYYVKDRQGNIRTVLTEGRDTAIYQATVEPARQGFEDSLFSNVYTPTSTWVLKSTVPAFDTDAGNSKVIKLNRNGNRIAAGITLKVMAGDKIQVNCFAYYNTTTQPPGLVNILNNILAVLPGGIVNNSGGKIGTGDQGTVSTLLSPNVTSFLSSRSYDSARPKAYLNWILFDNQFKYVTGGVVQALAGTSKQALVASLQTMSTNGYLYAYVSNESPQDVFFDDITVKHYTGPLVQEQSFYPFGVKMAAISDKAIKKASMPYQYNGGSEYEEELDYYGTFYRKYDAQIGRFTGVDILAESTAGLSPFHFGANNPVMFNDPTGAKSDRLTQNPAGVSGKRHDWSSMEFQMATARWLTQWENLLNAIEGLGFADDGGGGAFEYKSMDAAAIAWSLRYNGMSISDGTEFSSLIYKNGKGYSYTQALYWNKTLVDVNYASSAPGPSNIRYKFKDLLAGKDVVAHIHSHGAFDNISDEKFSTWRVGFENDKNYDIYGAKDGSGMAAKNPDLYLYLVTPAGNLYRRDKEESWNDRPSVYYIAGGFEHDENALRFARDNPGELSVSLHLHYRFEYFLVPNSTILDLNPIP